MRQVCVNYAMLPPLLWWQRAVNRVCYWLRLSKPYKYPNPFKSISNQVAE